MTAMVIDSENSGNGPGLTVVIPAYNEAATIAEVIGRALAVNDSVIVVDDGSTDDTAAIAEKFPVTLIRNPDNAGKAASLVTGMNHALKTGAELIATLDGDGQHRPEDLPLLVDMARDNPGCIVIGSRLDDPDAFPRDRYIANRTADFWISWASGQRVRDSQSGFRIYPRAVLERVRVPHGRERSFVFESEILIVAARAGFPNLSVPIPALYDGTVQRESHLNPFRDISRIVLMVAWKLLSWGLYPQGLWRTLTGRHPAAQNRL